MAKKFSLNRDRIIFIIVGATIFVGVAYTAYSLWALNNDTGPAAEAAPAVEATPTSIETEAGPTETSPAGERPASVSTDTITSTEVLTATRQLPPDVQRYTAEISQKTRALATSIVEMGVLLQNANVNDRAWSLAVALQVLAIRSTHEDLQKMTPPADLAAVHATVLEASGDCNTAMESLVRGIDNQSVEDLTAGSQLMQSCAQKLRRATEALTTYLAQNE